jgi:hypothetical protein
MSKPTITIDAIATTCIAGRVRIPNRVVTNLYDEALRPFSTNDLRQRRPAGSRDSARDCYEECSARGEAGIPYEDENGLFADFHGAGRHSFITALLSSGATLTEARELARHGDIRMTMRYTHISINDQASALASLPAPLTPTTPALAAARSATGTDGPDSWQRPGSDSAVSPCLFVSPDGEGSDGQGDGPEAQNPCRGQGFDVGCQLVAIAGEGEQQRGRRVSNPQPPA